MDDPRIEKLLVAEQAIEEAIMMFEYSSSYYQELFKGLVAISGIIRRMGKR